MLAHRPSLDLLDGLDLDFLTANYGLGSDMEMSMKNENRNNLDNDPRKSDNNQHQKDGIENGSDEMQMSEYLNNDEFLFEFENENDSYKTEVGNVGNKNLRDRVESWGSQFRRSSLSGGSFDLSSSIFDGFSNNENFNFNLSNHSRKNSLSQPIQTSAKLSNNSMKIDNDYSKGNNNNNLNDRNINNINSDFNSNGHVLYNKTSSGSFSDLYGEVDLSAYQSMAASLQAQTESDQVSQ